MPGPSSSQACGLGMAVVELETNTMTREAGGSGQAINRALEPMGEVCAGALVEAGQGC